MSVIAVLGVKTPTLLLDAPWTFHFAVQGPNNGSTKHLIVTKILVFQGLSKCYLDCQAISKMKGYSTSTKLPELRHRLRSRQAVSNRNFVMSRHSGHLLQSKWPVSRTSSPKTLRSTNHIGGDCGKENCQIGRYDCVKWGLNVYSTSVHV
jgi:hypothetical protein